MNNPTVIIRKLEAALELAKMELTIPAAEYVPAIPATWEHLQSALALIGPLRNHLGQLQSDAAHWNYFEPMVKRLLSCSWPGEKDAKIGSSRLDNLADYLERSHKK